MPVIGTYNSASIIEMPTKPGIRQMSLEWNDTVAAQRNIFTSATSKLFQWPGGDWWSGEVTLPQMNAATVAQWTAFLGACRGMLNCFLLGPPLSQRPRGLVNRTSKPVVSGTNNAMATSLVTRGWKPSAYNLLAAGDYIQLGATPNNATQPGLCRLHMVLDRVDSDANGNATLNLYPSLRETVTDGYTIVLQGPRGLFRLAENKRSVLSVETGLSALSFSVMEAR